MTRLTANCWTKSANRVFIKVSANTTIVHYIRITIQIRGFHRTHPWLSQCYQWRSTQYGSRLKSNSSPYFSELWPNLGPSRLGFELKQRRLEYIIYFHRHALCERFCRRSTASTDCCSIAAVRRVRPVLRVSSQWVPALVRCRLALSSRWRSRCLRVPAGAPPCTCWWSWSPGPRCRNSSPQATPCAVFLPAEKRRNSTALRRSKKATETNKTKT